jgi:hypothetical protein
MPKAHSGVGVSLPETLKTMNNDKCVMNNGEWKMENGLLKDLTLNTQNFLSTTESTVTSGRNL